MARAMSRTGHDARPARRPIALIGLMGAGKTTVGWLLARDLKRRFVDMDEALARAAGASVTAQFAGPGEADFRRRESALLAQLADRPDGPVVATGGGVILSAANRRLLARKFDTFWLDLSADEAWRRLRTSAGRPLLSQGPGSRPAIRLRHHARIRRPWYAASGRRIIATGYSANTLADRIGRALEDS